VNQSDDTVIIEITGIGEKIDRAIQLVPEDSILELVRSGSLGIATGTKVLKLESM